jgi:DNA-binding transcriptional ArsR family regulator
MVWGPSRGEPLCEPSREAGAFASEELGAASHGKERFDAPLLLFAQGSGVRTEPIAPIGREWRLYPWQSGRTLPLTYSDIGIYFLLMARAATTADAFNAVAEPRRRQILDALAGGELPVNDIVALLGLGQPQVSKHLRVLREVGAVEVRSEGKQRLYRLNGEALKPIHDWVKEYERTWTEQFERLDEVLEELKSKEQGDGSDDSQR